MTHLRHKCEFILSFQLSLFALEFDNDKGDKYIDFTRSFYQIFEEILKIWQNFKRIRKDFEKILGRL